jgi:ribosome-associated protein
MSQEEEWVSKTQRKKDMDALQDMGVKLTKLSADTLKKLPIPEDLLAALLDHKKITSHSALKRQLQYIGRIMRDVDPEPIEAYLMRLKGEDNAHNAAMQRIEVWRDRLLADDNALTELLNEVPNAPASEMRTLIRNARKEKEQSKPPKSFRALFKLLRQYLADHDSTATSSTEDDE